MIPPHSQSASPNGDEARNQTPGPLAGLTVLDMSRILAAPTCTQLLGDLGAEVLKIEKPGAGDDTRKWGPPFLKRADGTETGESAYYLSSNRNKRSVAIDIAQPAGAAIVRALAGQADVFIENFKTGDLKRYGLDYGALSAAHPGLVYCSVTGFGQTGPNAAKPGYDLMAQGFAGIMSLTGAPEGEPMKVGVGVGDVVCGLYAAVGVLAALRRRDLTGRGQHIDIALADATMAWLVNEGVNTLLSGQVPIRRGNQHPNIAPYQTFATADGHAIVAVGNDAQYRRFCAILGAPHLAEDPRFATNPERLRNRAALLSALEPLIARWRKDDLIAAMEAEGVPGGPINTVKEVFETDQAAAREMVISAPHGPAGTDAPLIGNPLKLSETPVAYRLAPPVRGQDTLAVLRARIEPALLEAALEAGALEDAGADGAPRESAQAGGAVGASR
ncbi:MAG: CoA transferase [Pseudomonadota bacterium]